MRYYLVTAKCGHVGKGKYFEVDFPIKAETKSEAAQYCLTKPKVKKHLDNAISYVVEITYDEYIEKTIEHKNDSFVKAHTKKEIAEYFDIANELPLNRETKKSSFESRKERIYYLLKKYKLQEECCYD